MRMVDVKQVYTDLKLYTIKNDGKKNNSRVFEVLMCPVEGC